MTSTYLKFDRKNALAYQHQMVTEMLKKNTSILRDLAKETKDMKNMRKMLTSCPDTWKPLLQLLKSPSKEEDDEKKLLFQHKVVNFLKTKLGAINLMIEDNRDPKVNKPLFLFFLKIISF